MRLHRKHEHRLKPMGAVSFTVYSDLGRPGPVHVSQQPALIFACDCGEWKYRELNHGDQGRKMWP